MTASQVRASSGDGWLTAHCKDQQYGYACRLILLVEQRVSQFHGSSLPNMCFVLRTGLQTLFQVLIAAQAGRVNSAARAGAKHGLGIIAVTVRRGAIGGLLLRASTGDVRSETPTNVSFWERCSKSLPTRSAHTTVHLPLAAFNQGQLSSPQSLGGNAARLLVTA